MPRIIRLPDTLATWPYPRRINPFYAALKIESSAWLESFNAFSLKAQKAFNRCDFNLLASLAYPTAPRHHLRTGMDLMNLFFVFDEYTDQGTAEDVRDLADIVMNALHYPAMPRPRGENIVGEIMRQFWERAKMTATPSAAHRFVETFALYTNSVVEQALDREHSVIRTVDAYLSIRRDTIGAKPSFALLEFDMNLPTDVIEHPTMVSLINTTIDLLILGNDLCSYNVEQARGDDGHNIITVVMVQFKLDLDAVLDWISQFHDSLVAQFLMHARDIPSWGPVLDPQVGLYIDGLGNWVRANDCWSFESERYFGKAGLKIQKHRCLTLLDKI
ncbi:terpenoid synthase [Mycena maculata]|uniref:Terpene synthase n=1 Tax=Mycena maculata TaxID=230809 RepID=A0AAD7I8I2_9AGAR|nr:terpenoid synthase [Mycena maculata]